MKSEPDGNGSVITTEWRTRALVITSPWKWVRGDLICNRTDVEKEEAWIEKLSRKRVCPTSQFKAKLRSGSEEAHNQGNELSMKTSVEMARARDYTRDGEMQWEKRVCATWERKMGRGWDTISESKENLGAALFRKVRKNGRWNLWITETEEKPNMQNKIKPNTHNASYQLLKFFKILKCI